MKKLCIEIRLCNLVTYDFKGQVKIFKICTAKFKVNKSVYIQAVHADFADSMQ